MYRTRRYSHPGYSRVVAPDDLGSDRSAPAARDIGRALSWLAVGQVVGQSWWYGSLVVLAMLLSPSDFGTIAAGLVVVQLAQYLMDSGTRGSLIVALHLSRELLYRALAFNVGTGALLTLVVAAIAQPFVDMFASGGQAAPIRFLAVSILLSSLVPVPMAVLQRNLDFKRQATVMGVAATTASIAAVGAAALGAGVWSLALRQVLFQVVIACLSWWSVRGLLPDPTADSEHRKPVRQEQAFWFFTVSLSKYLAFSVHYLVVGGVTDARQLGLYSLAFTLAFSPVTQFSSQIGKVVLPAMAATRDLAVIARRAVKATRLLALIIAPCVPPAIAVAPAVLPAALGQEWTNMVLPFQILLAAAMGHVLLSVLQESLSGTGSVRFVAMVSTVWFVTMVAILVILVRLDGIRGAAMTHVIVLVPLVAVYVTAGARRLGFRATALSAALRGIIGAVMVQGAVTATTVVGLRAIAVQSEMAAVAGALLGLATVGVLIWRLDENPVHEARVLIHSIRRQAA